MNRRTFATMFASSAAISASGRRAVACRAEGRRAGPRILGRRTATGKTVNLNDYRGKTIVLEWTNDGCPYVRKHYGSGNMQALQKKWTDQGVVWLSVISSPPGEQGFADGTRANSLTTERKATPTAVLLDPKQQVARAYGATVTPHMYIIKPDGTLAYAGGIDDKPTTRPADIKDAKNFVDEALAELKAGKPVSNPATRAYGCTVKYSS